MAGVRGYSSKELMSVNVNAARSADPSRSMDMPSKTTQADKRRKEARSDATCDAKPPRLIFSMMANCVDLPKRVGHVPVQELSAERAQKDH